MLRKLIAHQIIKAQHANTAELHLRDQVLPIDSELSDALLTQLRESFQKRNPAAGVFKSTGETQPRFQQMLIRYPQGDEDEAPFVTLTTDAMTVLLDVMVREPLATGGYVVFAEYDSNNVTYLLTALLSTMAKPSFDEDLNLVASIALDLDHLRHGARVRLAGVADNTDGVVQFISQRRDGVSEYFVDFIGCEAVVRSDIQGRRLYTALDGWAAASNLNEEDKWQLMARAHSYWHDCYRERRPMTLTALANVISPEDPEPLLLHLGQEGYQLSGEFSPPPPSTMKRFVRFTFSAEGLRLEFDRNRWENHVRVVNRQSRTITISGVPEQLIAAIDERV
jgi:nucleoid-associated protein